MAKFATAINCMDGRVQLPVAEYIKRNYSIDYVDIISLPGPDKVLAEGKDKNLIDFVKRCVEISIDRHNSDLIAIAGHHDCAGNPVDKETHLQNIIAAVERIATWQFPVKIIGLWVDENWKVHLLGHQPEPKKIV